jgi:hypothetical protein
MMMIAKYFDQDINVDRDGRLKIYLAPVKRKAGTQQVTNMWKGTATSLDFVFMI